MRNLAIAFVVTFVSFVMFCLGAVMPLLAHIGGLGFLIGAIGSVVAPVVGLLSPVRTENPFVGGQAPKRFVSYYYLKSNYGGISLALDLETGILYGQYSSN
jgi:hypothetical protein